MLNFGYWEKDTKDPISAQKNLCDLVGEMTDLKNAKNLLDVGSGFSEPASIWKKRYNTKITSLNINQNQLRLGRKSLDGNLIEFVNSTATRFPFRESTFDRVIALESAQHFRPLEKFITESARVLKKGGILGMALPILSEPKGFELLKIGILKFTWSSEHYDLDTLKRSLVSNGFDIAENKTIGDWVYSPLAEYYIKNREFIKSKILQKYPTYVETILYRSIQKMKEVSEKDIIQYAVIKAIRSN